MTQLSSISFPVTWSHYQTVRETPQLHKAMDPAVFLWFSFQLLLTQGCDGADSSGANLVAQQLMHGVQGDKSAGLTYGKMPK